MTRRGTIGRTRAVNVVDRLIRRGSAGPDDGSTTMASHELSHQNGRVLRAGRGRGPSCSIAPPQHGQISSETPVSCDSARGSRPAPAARAAARPEASAQRELGGAMAVGQEAVVADAVEAVRQDVQQEAADELVGG